MKFVQAKASEPPSKTASVARDNNNFFIGLFCELGKNMKNLPNFTSQEI
jgi:hypothetical protein